MTEMPRILHRAWRKAVRKGRAVYLMIDRLGAWHCLFAQRAGCRLKAIIGMRPDGRGPYVVRV